MQGDAGSFWDRLDRIRASIAAGDRDGAAAALGDAARRDRPRDPALDTARQDFLDDLAGRLGLDHARPDPLPEPIPDPAPDRVPDRALPGIAPGGRPGISLVTCCMNREENLLRALPSWLACPEIAEVVIVDWSSERPVRAALDAAGLADPRIRVVRVEGEPRWILSCAFNAGFRVAACDQVLKADADIVLEPGFFATNHLQPGQFIAGNWRTAASDQAFVNGFFQAWKDDLAAVAGFNEYITSYGWDDDDLYDRLERHGCGRRDVATGSIHHLPHSDEARLGAAAGQAGVSALDELTRSTMHNIRQNRLLAYIMPVWEPGHTLLPLRIEAEDGTGLTLRRAGALPHPVPDHVAADARFYATQEMASWRLGREVWGLDRDRLARLLARPFADLGPEAVAAALQDPAAPALAPGRARVFVDAQHGLGNRLRAIGSAAAIAAGTDRELVVIWQPDAHCDCRFGDLYDYDAAVIDESFADRAAAQGCSVYNYMEVEPGAEKGAPIRGDGGDLYLRSAYVLNSPLSSWEAENRFLRRLRPVGAVRDLVAAVRSPNDVSAHVRMAGGAAYEHLAYESPANWTEAGHAEIAGWRQKSHFARFMDRIDRLEAEVGAARIFLAADTPEAYAAFAGRYGDRLAVLDRALYDRSAAQLRYALADAILLGRAPLLLGSSWSSFSELALRLAPREMTVEMSGRDF